MVSKPKPCKYGCGTMITWHEIKREFQPLNSDTKHDCRDWPGVSGQVVTQTAPPTNTFNQGPPSNETLIGVQAKKTWENYFKLLEPLTANSAAMVSAIEETNKHLVHIGAAIQSLEQTLSVLKIKSIAKKDVEEDTA